MRMVNREDIVSTAERTHTSKHKPPVQAGDTALIRDFLECNIDKVSEHDTERRPCLPHHDEGATDERRRTPASPTRSIQKRKADGHIWKEWKAHSAE